MRRTLLLVCIVVTSTQLAFAGPKTVAVLEEHLQAGTLSTGQALLSSELEKNPKDADARFGLGTLQFLSSVERLSKSLYRYGLLQQQRTLIGGLGIELPIGINPQPEKITYEQARAIIQQLVTDLTKAEATLALIDTEEVKLPLHFGLIRLDLNGDGKTDPDKTLWRIYARLNRGAINVSEKRAQAFVIAFDTGDVYWLRGYCHLLMAFGETALAHDWQELFKRVGHVIFPSTDSPYPFLKEATPGDTDTFFSFNRLSDLIAYIHLINFQVKEPERMHAALGHLESMVAVSSRSWDFILKETDNDQEWLPNPKQTGVIPNVVVTDEMIESWRHFLAEAKTILKGEKLIPFWRGAPGRGINLRLVFMEPAPFDLVLWIQGTGAAPYLQKGPSTDPEVWRRLQRVFGGEFIGFALWFN
ncbi:MAG: hypothetical protein JWN70_1627 [Planctomycetaceae bacterium]|nr:hypothetical protein [Planctomycetaceae bacterium]